MWACFGTFEWACFGDNLKEYTNENVANVNFCWRAIEWAFNKIFIL